MSSSENMPTTKPYDWPAIIKDIVGSGIITFLILTPIVAFKTTLDQGSLTYSTRWPLVLLLATIVVAGRLLFHLLVWNRIET